MTYRDLLKRLQELSPEQLDCDVTIEDPYPDECYPVKEFRICDTEHKSLDEDHPVLFLDY